MTTTTRTKLFEEVKSHITHSLNELSLDDLMDSSVLKKQFDNSIFKNFIQEELIPEEEEEINLIRQMELFKRDMLLNFTSSHMGMKIPNMSSNHIYDKFNSDFNNTYHNEFHTKVAETTNFLLSIYLNLAKTQTEKSKVLTLLSKLKEDLNQDSVAQQKFFTVFSIVNNLIKVLTIEKNIPEFFKLIDAYTKFLNNFVKDSRFTVYLVKDHIIELANLIIKTIIDASSVSNEIKDQGVGAIFKLGLCFKLPDLHINFIDSLIKVKFLGVNLREELNQLLEELFYENVDVFNNMDLQSVDLKYTENLKVGQGSSFATDGIYIYIHQVETGLYKIGSGFGNTIKGKIYGSNKSFFPGASGSLAYCCGRLYFRSPNTAPNPFVVVNVDNLSVINRNISNENLFVDKENKIVKLNYKLQGHTLIDPNRSTESSKLISDGRYLYVVSYIGELRTTEEEFKSLYPNDCLINVDIIDPLDNFNLITSIPVIDPKNLLGNKSKKILEAFSQSIFTDGKTIFFKKEEPVYFNLITKSITDVEENIPQNNSQYMFLDPFNSLIWSLNQKDEEYSSLQYAKINLNSFIVGLQGSYPGLKSFNHFNLKEISASIYYSHNNTTQAVTEKEANVCEFFFKKKSKTTKEEKSNTKMEITSIISFLLNSLAQSAVYNLNHVELNSQDILSHLFHFHTLDLNSGTIQILLDLYSYYKSEFFDNSNHEIESKYFILSSFLKIFNGIMRQIQILKYEEFKTFKEDFGNLKEIVEDSIRVLIELYVSGDHYESFTIDLISNSLSIVGNYSKIFSVEFPNFEIFLDLITKNSENLIDFKNTIIKSAGLSGKNVFSGGNIQILVKILEISITKNNNLVHEAISGFLDSTVTSTDPINSQAVDYQKSFENLLTPLLKLIFNTYLDITQSKDDDKQSKYSEFQELIINFEKVFLLLNNQVCSLIKGIDNKLSNTKFASQSKFEEVQETISDFINKNSYAYRFYFASLCLINLLSDEKSVIFKTWHHVYESLIQFDRSLTANKVIFAELEKREQTEPSKSVSDIYPEMFHLLVETPHPVTKEVKFSKEYNFKDNFAGNIYVEFDPLSFKDSSSELEIQAVTKNGENTFTFKNGFENITLKNVTKLIVKLSIAANPSSYGVKCFIHNKKKYRHYFERLHNNILSVTIRSIKTFFFFDYKSADKIERDLDDLLQSKLFQGGINELLDLETSSDEYKNFINSLKSSKNYSDFEKRFSQESEEYEEIEIPPFEIEEFIYKENLHVEKFIFYAQNSLIMRFPWINIGGENAEKIVRAAFAVLIKQEKLYETIIEVVEKISEAEEKKLISVKDSTLNTKELSEIENFEFLLLTWSEVSRLRQWYQEQIKDLAEFNNENFDKQNEDFIKSVVDKCKFMFTVNPPQGKGKKKKINLNFLHIFAQSQILSTVKVDNDVLKSNILKFKKTLMNGKIDEGKNETENMKKMVTSLIGCIKMTKVSIDSLRNSLQVVNTRAKFREIALSLINSLLLEIDSDDVKLTIVKEIVVTLRKTSSKRLISIDDEIKSASSSLISAIKFRFHNFLKIIFANLLKSNTIFYIAEYLDCLYWNLSARNQTVLIEIDLLNNLFSQSPNKIIKSIWDKITKLGKISSRKHYRYEFNEKSLGSQLLEFFDIYSSMIIGRIIDETHSTETIDSQQTNSFLRMKSSVFDNAFDELVKSICDIVSAVVRDYLSNYSKLYSDCNQYVNKFLPEEKFEKFKKEYFDENLLNTFLLQLYKFIINQSNLIIKHMKNPEFVAQLIVLLRYTSSKNKFTLSNIIKVYLVNLSEEDIHNIGFFLRKQELIRNTEIIGLNHDDAKFYPKNYIITYLLNILYEFRQGIFTNQVSLSSEYSESFYVLNLLKSLYNEDKWKLSFDNLFIECLSKDMLVSTILSVLNGDFEDLHYGSSIALKFKSNKPKSITELLNSKIEERNSCTNGFILGFCNKEENISEFKTSMEFKDFLINRLNFIRQPNDKYGLIITLANDTYSKNKLKSNDVEFQIRNINDIILLPSNDAKIDNELLIKELMKKYKDKLDLIKKENYSYLDYYYLNQITQSLKSIFSFNEVLPKEVQEILINYININDLISLLEDDPNSFYVNHVSNKINFVGLMKYYLDHKQSIKIEFNEKLVKDIEPIRVEALRFSRSLRLYKNDIHNGKIFKIFSTNLTIDTDSFKKLDNFSFVKLGDPNVKKYLNCLIYCTEHVELVEKLQKIDDINIVFLLPKKDASFAKINIVHPFITVEAENEEIEDLFRQFEYNQTVSPIKKVEDVDQLDMKGLNLTVEDINIARKTNENQGNSNEDNSIVYVAPQDFDKNEMITTVLTQINTPPINLGQTELKQALKKLALYNLRAILVNLVSLNSHLITDTNLDFIKNQFKIVFFDACQSSIITTFDYSKFKFILSLFNILADREKELLKITIDSKVFNSFKFNITENEIKNEIQTELLEIYLRKQNERNSINKNRESYIEAIGQTINIALITVNNEYDIFNQFLLKSRDLFNEYAKFISSLEEKNLTQFEEDINVIEKRGLNTLVKFLELSLGNEKNYSSRTKILFNFIWELALNISEVYRKTFKQDKFYNYSDLANIEKLRKNLIEANLIYYKAREYNLRTNSLLEIDEIKQKLSFEIGVINSKYTLEKKLNFNKIKNYNIETNNIESKGKVFITTKKLQDGSFRVIDIFSENEKTPFKLNSDENLLIANKDLCTNELWMCGYNERKRMGNPALNDYEYVYVPIQSKIDGNIRIKKVINNYQSTVVLTYDNKIYVAGDGTNSGLSTMNDTFTLENQWNDIAKKETVIDIYANENTGFVMVTNKNIYGSGYNSCNVFGTCVSSGSYLNGITKLVSPFKTSKVLEVSLGYGHIMFLLDDGNVYGQGCNSCYELNLESNTYITTLTKIPIPSGMKAKKISCGYHSTLFLIKEKENKVFLYSCGDNGYGQNGQGNNSNKRFQKCLGVEDVQFKHIKMGYYCSCAISNNNQLYTWGYNGYYNLTHADTSYHYQPTLTDFFTDRTVLDAEINEKNLVVRCIDTDGKLKIFSSGYNGYGCMGIGSNIESYNKVPLEITTFKDSYIQKVFLTGTPYCVSFIKTNVSAIANSFQFKCQICNATSGDALHVIIREGKNTKVCIKCWKKNETLTEGISYSIRSINITTCKDGNLDSIQLPDLSKFYELFEEKLEHSIQCYDCKILIGKGLAYVCANNIKSSVIAFCEECYANTAYFEIPSFVYSLKYAVEYSSLPELDSHSLLGYEVSDKLKLSGMKILNDEGLREFFKENKTVIDKIINQYDEIKSEQILEYLKLVENNNKINNISEEVKKISALEKLSEFQLKIIEILIVKIDNAMKNIRNFVAMDMSNIIKEIYISNLNYLSKNSRTKILDNMIYANTNEVSADSYSVYLSRGKAIKFKQKIQLDSQGIYTIFSQIFNECKKIPLTQYNCKKNNRLFKVYLKGEAATDAGGPYREMMNILCDELQSPYLNLFIPTPNNRSSSGQDRDKWTINPSAKTNLQLEMFKFIGKLFSFAIRSTGYLNLNLPSFIWKQILNQPLDIQDLERIDIHTSNFLSDLSSLEEKGIDEEQFEYIYDQQFTTVLSNGIEVELMSGGKEKRLTYSDSKEYVKHALKTRFEECSVQIDAIKSGLFDILNNEITLFLNWKELEEMVCGNVNVDVDWLKQNTIYETWTENDSIITWFWQAFKKFTNEERILYLKFVWGRSRLPLTKEGYYHKHKITKAYSNRPDISLPLSHTCFFTIDIPHYSSYDILYKKLSYAIKFCSEIDNDGSTSEALEDL